MNSNEYVQGMEKLVKGHIANIHTASPGQILAFDAGSCTATVQPLLKHKVSDGRSLDMPPIVGAPVVFPSGMGGNISITWPLQSGDGCLLVYAESGIDDWLKGGESSDLRKHSITDAIVIPGLSASGVAVASDGLCLKFGSASIMLKADGTISFGGSKLDMNGISFADHVHTGVAVGSEKTGKPTGG